MDVSIHNKFYKGEAEGFGKYCKKVYGKAMSKVIARRLEHARAATSLADLTIQGFPGRWHWLTGDRRGQISADLDRMVRILFEPDIPASEYTIDGTLDGTKIQGIILVEVTDTHE